MMPVMDEGDRGRLAARIRVVLRRAKAPLSLLQIAEKLDHSTIEIYEALSINLHGFYEMQHSKFRWLR